MSILSKLAGAQGRKDEEPNKDLGRELVENHDVEGIRTYIAQDSPRYADLQVDRIMAAVERLALFPESGRVVPELSNPSIREVILRPYRIVYRLKEGRVEIATVFRASRLLPALE